MALIPSLVRCPILFYPLGYDTKIPVILDTVSSQPSTLENEVVLHNQAFLKSVGTLQGEQKELHYDEWRLGLDLKVKVGESGMCVQGRCFRYIDAPHRHIQIKLR